MRTQSVHCPWEHTESWPLLWPVRESVSGVRWEDWTGTYMSRRPLSFLFHHRRPESVSYPGFKHRDSLPGLVSKQWVSVWSADTWKPCCLPLRFMYLCKKPAETLKRTSGRQNYFGEGGWRDGWGLGVKSVISLMSIPKNVVWDQISVCIDDSWGAGFVFTRSVH